MEALIGQTSKQLSNQLLETIFPKSSFNASFEVENNVHLVFTEEGSLKTNDYILKVLISHSLDKICVLGVTGSLELYEYPLQQRRYPARKHRTVATGIRDVLDFDWIFIGNVEYLLTLKRGVLELRTRNGLEIGNNFGITNKPNFIGSDSNLELIYASPTNSYIIGDYRYAKYLIKLSITHGSLMETYSSKMNSEKLSKPAWSANGTYFAVLNHIFDRSINRTLYATVHIPDSDASIRFKTYDIVRDLVFDGVNDSILHIASFAGVQSVNISTGQSVRQKAFPYSEYGKILSLYSIPSIPHSIIVYTQNSGLAFDTISGNISFVQEIITQVSRTHPYFIEGNVRTTENLVLMKVSTEDKTTLQDKWRKGVLTFKEFYDQSENANVDVIIYELDWAVVEWNLFLEIVFFVLDSISINVPGNTWEERLDSLLTASVERNVDNVATALRQFIATKQELLGKCSNHRDPISQESLAIIPDDQIVKVLVDRSISLDDILYTCFDRRNLVDWLEGSIRHDGVWTIPPFNLSIQGGQEIIENYQEILISRINDVLYTLIPVPTIIMESLKKRKRE